MRLAKKFIKSPNFIPLIIVVFFAVLAAKFLIFQSGYFIMHDDLQMMRQLEMEKCFNDGQIPCRWVPDMGYGYGFPLFNFYPPLPYLVGEVFRILQFSFVNTVKLTFALSFILSGITMYFLSKEFFGKWGGVVSAVFYIWAPYHSVDTYVRGAMNEAWALVWFPLILFTSYKLITGKKDIEKWIISLALSWVGLLLSHNLMVMIFTPLFALWCFVFWFKQRNWVVAGNLFISGFMALALAAFFTIPAVVEQRLIHVETLTEGYYNYIVHYATIGQLLISRYWGYGPSTWGPNDGLSFSIGHLHWILSVILIIVWLYGLIAKKKNYLKEPKLFIIPLIILSGWFAAFMTHQNSYFIWSRIKFLSFVQFPWRFLTLVMLCFSFAAGAIFVMFPKKIAVLMGILLSALVVILNWNYFEPLNGHMGPLTDTQKFTGLAWQLQKTAGIYDYLPLTAKENPKAGPNGLAEVVTGKGNVESATQGTNWVKFNTDLTSDSEIRINIFDFPTWKITEDGKEINHTIPDQEKWGRMYINLPSGSHSVYLKLQNTPIRTITNYISIISWLVLLSFPVWKKKLPRIMLQFKRG